jgi:hypothetical protein
MSGKPPGLLNALTAASVQRFALVTENGYAGATSSTANDTSKAVKPTIWRGLAAIVGSRGARIPCHSPGAANCVPARGNMRAVPNVRFGGYSRSTPVQSREVLVAAAAPRPRLL